MSENIPHNCMCEVCGKDFDTATAKLRESVSQWMKNHDAVCKLYQRELSKSAKLKAEHAKEIMVALVQQRDELQLAHQQPSSDDILAQPHAPRQPSPPPLSQQPSSTTPDVEKIAREIEAIYNELEGQFRASQLRDCLGLALAQAREPLVKDEVRLDELSCGSRFTGKFDYLAGEWTITINDQPYHGKTIREAIDAALTGTEEKQ